MTITKLIETQKLKAKPIVNNQNIVVNRMQQIVKAAGKSTYMDLVFALPI